MAGKKNYYDNEELHTILYGYKYLNQFTSEAIEIIEEVINREFDGTTSRSKVGRLEILKIILECPKLGYDEVKNNVNTRRMNRMKWGEKPLGKSMIYVYKRIAEKAAQELLEAYNHGVMIKYPLMGDGRQVNQHERKKIHQMLRDGTSLGSIKAYINGL
ncbi:TPA: hypothetical protein ACXF8C_004621 [Enterobacter cloacae]|uniref:hypothetical protein n=1 Tax=Enterobacter cloacae TaxID=550 RepID=UPI001F2B24FD|nr:hypothetical protein [Enterobacter cloacae]ELD2091558.1 hypothetical protein [Enterobacter hormaechei]MCF2228620.1 hypothetical protein [Enterobacter cloacae]MDV5404814.1 hypothetical protein [Enterobacter cloacae]MEB7115263.1 hypothetical protein [Enterobacter cloacae]HAV2174679.1 hypothetical protein [Enterobacter cloacae]